VSRIRVLVVDDSAFARRVMRDVLSADARIEVVGHATDGLHAIEQIEARRPDVVTLDLVMPELDGVGVLDALRLMPEPPRVVVCSTSAADGPLAIAALSAGAFDLVTKPTALATDRLYEVGRELVEKVVLASAHRAPARVAARAAPVTASAATRARVVVVGASTGGPRAVSSLLSALPKDFPVPIAIVVHMPVGYTEAFAARLDAECALRVFESAPATPLVAGGVAIARAGVHLRIERRGEALVLAHEREPASQLHRPSVDELFASAAAALGRGVLGVVLTGMGSDGLEGAKAIRAAGGRLLVESATTCVVYGMPRAVMEAGLAEAEATIEAMPGAIAARL